MRVLFLVLCVAVVSISVSGEKEYVIFPGVGIDSLRIGGGVPVEHIRNLYASDQVFYNSANGIITSIVVVNPVYHTSEGIKIGSSIVDLVEVYGPSDRIEVPLLKGSAMIGSAGVVARHKGVDYFIDNDVVIAIMIHGMRENTQTKSSD
jgi:hypothetical protein